MQSVAAQVWAQMALSLQTMWRCVAVCSAVLATVSLSTFWATEYLSPATTQTRFAWAAVAEVLVLQALVWLWCQGAVARLVLRHALLNQPATMRDLLPDANLLSVGATSILSDGLALGSLAALLPAFRLLDHQIGRISASLSLGLLVPLALVACMVAQRRALASAPLALSLGDAQVESWEITRGHVLFEAALQILAAVPVMVVLLVGSLVFRHVTAPAVLGASLVAAVWFAQQAALQAELYRRWRTEIRPDMRPSRNPRRRKRAWFGREEAGPAVLPLLEGGDLAGGRVSRPVSWGNGVARRHVRPPASRPPAGTG